MKSKTKYRFEIIKSIALIAIYVIVSLLVIASTFPETKKFWEIISSIR